MFLYLIPVVVGFPLSLPYYGYVIVDTLDSFQRSGEQQRIKLLPPDALITLVLLAFYSGYVKNPSMQRGTNCYNEMSLYHTRVTGTL